MTAASMTSGRMSCPNIVRMCEAEIRISPSWLIEGIDRPPVKKSFLPQIADRQCCTEEDIRIMIASRAKISALSTRYCR